MYNFVNFQFQQKCVCACVIYAYKNGALETSNPIV